MGREYSDAELIRRGCDGRLLDVRTTMAAEIVSFDANTMTATVRPGVRVQVVDADSAPEVVTLPDIEDVPVMFPTFGPAILYHPLPAGSVGRLEFSEEDDGDFYDDGATAPVNPRVLKRHGGACVFRPSGVRGEGALGSENPAAGFMGRPGGVGMAFDETELRLGESGAEEYAAIASLVEKAIKNAITGHTHTSPAGGATGNGALTGTIDSTAAKKVKIK